MRRVLILITCMALISGCTKSNIVKPGTKQEPNFEVIEGITLDNNQIREDLEAAIEYYENPEISVRLEASMSEDGNTLDLNLTVQNDTEPSEAAAYASYMIKAYSDAVATQDFSYSASTENTYGGYFDTRSIHVVVATAEAKDKPLVEQTIEAGTNTPVEAIKK